MGRIYRQYCSTKTYHVMVRGNGHMNLFFDDQDREFYLKMVKKYKEAHAVTIYAYCLMDNHVHFLTKAENQDLSSFFRKIGQCYAQYYNKKYDHVGHVFQNRFKSVPVREKRYFLATFNYILKNPQSAGICMWNNYRWSNAADLFTSRPGIITDISLPVLLAQDRTRLIHMIDSDEYEMADTRVCEIDRCHISDSEAVTIIKNVLKNDNPLSLQSLDKKSRNTCLAKICTAGVSIRQAERLTGINRNIIQRNRQHE